MGGRGGVVAVVDVSVPTAVTTVHARSGYLPTEARARSLTRPRPRLEPIYTVTINTDHTIDYKYKDKRVLVVL